MKEQSFDTVEKALRYIKTEYQSQYVNYEEAKRIIDILLDPFLKEESASNKSFGHETKEEYNTFLEKRLELAGKSLNSGESKKTDFELFGDRYNVKDISISPSSPTIIIRKHAEQKNHLTVDDLLKNNQLSPEIINFLSTCIKGADNS